MNSREPNTIIQFDNETGKFVKVSRYDLTEVDPVIRELNHPKCQHPSGGCLGILLAIFLASCIGAAYLFKLVFLN